jgi:hypothetical protein
MIEEPEQNSRTHYLEYLCSHHEGERYPLVGAGYYPGTIDIGMRYCMDTCMDDSSDLFVEESRCTLLSQHLHTICSTYMQIFTY